MNQAVDTRAADTRAASCHGQRCPAVKAGTADRALPPQALAVYLFALVRGAKAGAPFWSEKDPFPELFIHRAGTIGAVVSMVELADYAGPAASQLLGDVAWVGPRAVYHAGVLRQAMQWSPVFPVPFGTDESRFSRKVRSPLGDFRRPDRGSQVRRDSPAGGKWIRTIGPRGAQRRISKKGTSTEARKGRRSRQPPYGGPMC
jgi:hypothetical protein